MFLALLTAVLITLKHCQFGHCCPVRVHDDGDEAGEPRDSGGQRRSQHRVLQWKELRRKLRIQKKWQPGVPALPPKRQSKTTFRAAQSGQGIISLPPPARPSAAPANIPLKETDQAVSRPERCEGLTNWTPLIVGACLTGRALVFLWQMRSPAWVAAGPVDSAPKQPVDKPPRPDCQLKASPDPFYM